MGIETTVEERTTKIRFARPSEIMDVIMHTIKNKPTCPNDGRRLKPSLNMHIINEKSRIDLEGKDPIIVNSEYLYAEFVCRGCRKTFPITYQHWQPSWLPDLDFY
jgi:hypothetical protein